MVRKRRLPASTVLVVGLGRFGYAAAVTMLRLGIDVLAIDERVDMVQRYSNELPHVAQLDATDPEALDQIGVRDFDRAVVAIGSDLEASIMTVLGLSEAGVSQIWAKAVSSRHGLILERVGAHKVIYPERSMGRRVAHMVAGNMNDFIEFDDGFSIARAVAPEFAWGKTLAASVIRSTYDVTIVGVKRPGMDFAYGRPETIVQAGDELVVAGATPLVEAFCRLR
ncbi:potassium channel family protein [Granulicoccus sp. GXG6511]|uniref:potassium channel family protein n=1 Tax=Granulicoccus sp. GXG6511 TaxID=3381351 RepID=UPI003D7E3913